MASSSRRAVSPVPVPSSSTRRAPDPLAATSSSWKLVVDRDVARGSSPRRWRGRSGTATPAPPATSPRDTAPCSHDPPLPGRLVARAGRPPSRRVPGSSPPSITRSAPAPDRLGHARPGAAPPDRRPGWRSTAAPASARRPAAAPRAPAAPASTGRRRRRAETAARDWAAARVTGAGQQPLQRRPRALARAPAAPPAPARRSKNITADGLSIRRRLSAYSRSTATRLCSVAGQPVDGVGREHRDPADRHAALEGRRAAAAGHGAPDHHSVDGRPGRAARRPSRTRPRPAARRPPPACSGAISSATSGNGARRVGPARHQPTDHVEPVRRRRTAPPPAHTERSRAPARAPSAT